jgi:hypothetical protein
MLDKRVDRQNVLDALIFIDKNGVPKKRNSTKFTLHQDNKIYPPKYILSIATKIATGKELEPKEFSGGQETNSFLMSLGFTIKEGNKQL